MKYSLLPNEKYELKREDVQNTAELLTRSFLKRNIIWR
jgi:hypothetical protein